MAPSAPPPSHLPYFVKYQKKGFFYNEVVCMDILSLTLTLGCKTKKQPSGPIEPDLEAGNLVLYYYVSVALSPDQT